MILFNEIISVIGGYSFTEGWNTKTHKITTINKKTTNVIQI